MAIEIQTSVNVNEVIRQNHLEWHKGELQNHYMEKAALLQRLGRINASLMVSDDVYAECIWPDIMAIGKELGIVQKNIKDTREKISECGQDPDSVQIILDGNPIFEAYSQGED